MGKPGNHTPVMRASRRRVAASVLALVLVALVASCRSGARASVSPSESPGAARNARVVPPGQAFGDTAAFEVQILSLDRVTEQASVTTRNGKNLIVLAVVPGREIEIIAPGASSMRRGKAKGVYGIDLRRVDDSMRPADANETAREQLAYDRCMSQAAATAKRIGQQRVVKRDSTGKVISEGSRSGSSDADQQRGLEAPCNRLASNSSARQPATFLPARPPADRYLVVLASTSPLPLAQLYERLATLTAVAPDVATTIEAIAAGLYVGARGTWSGYYVAW